MKPSLLLTVALMLFICQQALAVDTPEERRCEVSIYRVPAGATRAGSIYLTVNSLSGWTLEEGESVTISCPLGSNTIEAKTSYSKRVTRNEELFETGKRYYFRCEIILGGTVRLKPVVVEKASIEIQRCKSILKDFYIMPIAESITIQEEKGPQQTRLDPIEVAVEKRNGPISIEENRAEIITILDFQVENMSLSESKLIVDLLYSELVNSRKYTVIDRDRRDKILQEIEFSNSECTDETCQLEAGKLLSADKIIVGSIGKISNRYIINTKLLDVETSEALSISSEVYGSSDELVDNCRRIIKKLIQTAM